MQSERSALGQICRSLPRNAWDVLLEAYYGAGSPRNDVSGGVEKRAGPCPPISMSKVVRRGLWPVARGWAGETSRLEGQARFELSHRNGASLHTPCSPRIRKA